MSSTAQATAVAAMSLACSEAVKLVDAPRSADRRRLSRSMPSRVERVVLRRTRNDKNDKIAIEPTSPIIPNIWFLLESSGIT